MSAHGQVGGLIYESADFEEVVEYGRIILTRSRREEVAMSEGFQNLVRKLQPWSVEGGYVSPMSVRVRWRSPGKSSSVLVPTDGQ